MNIEKEYGRFIENFAWNKILAQGAEKPHLARWAYGACEEWIKDFQGSVEKTASINHYGKAIERGKQTLQRLKRELREKFSDDKTLMEMLK